MQIPVSEEQVPFTINCANHQERLLYYCFHNVLRYYEQSELGKFINRTLNENNLFLDVGANMGFYSYLAKKAGARVIAFEPEPQHADFLTRNPQCYDELHRVALSDESSSCTFYLGNHSNTGIHSLVLGDQNITNSDYECSIEVQTQRLDNIVSTETTLQHLTLIKVDVEGAEEKVINGAMGILERGFRPDIWCEVRGEQSNRNGGNYKPIIRLLSDFGYSPYVVQHGEKRIFDQQKNVKQVFDLLFIA